MEKQIKLIHKAGPFGDCTSQYEVTFPKNITVDEFMKLVIRENPTEWGDFCVYWNCPIVKYRDGKCFTSVQYDEYKDMKILRAQAHGGWSRMDYIIDPEKPPKPELKINFNNSTGYFPF
jgi:hypothetical protein